MGSEDQWFKINNAEEIDSPALLIYPDRIKKNIDVMIRMVGDTAKLRPHVKTYKMAEVVKMQLDAGIDKFKCATISEAEMLCKSGAKDVLLAYQPVGPKIDRLARLISEFPDVAFSALIDNPETARELSLQFEKAGKRLNVYLDLDTGNHRTGINPEMAFDLFRECQKYPGIEVVGLHAYDGHIRNSDLSEPKKVCDEAFRGVTMLEEKIRDSAGKKMEIIAGGTPTFPVHAQRNGVICSPGTCLLWDWGYHSKFSDLNFSFGTLVITRIISKVGNDRITLDLGHKAIASENPFPRVHFLNLSEQEHISQSEEHLVIRVTDNSIYNIGETFYGVPIHVCPTCALYEEAQVVYNNIASETWPVVARKRTITI